MRNLLELILPTKKPSSSFLNIDIAGKVVKVELKRHDRARRMTLRLTRGGDGVVLSLPRLTSLGEAKSFLQRSSPWLTEQLSRQKSRVTFCAGAELPLRGQTVVLMCPHGSRGLIRLEGQTLIVPGRPEHVPRRLTEWLKSRASEDLLEACTRHADAMGVKVRRITVRDQKSRWGSCSSSGDLAFSWRLILAPAHVLDYVAAHEVAHLLEMNHSPRFWRHVLKHCPHAREAKNWMRHHGGDLHRYG
jgi:hypothetical protein